MVFILSKIYQTLPQSVKNNSKVIELVQRFNNNNKLKELESHYRMLDIIFSSCQIKATGTTRDIQLLSLELLRLLDNICQKHNITYWIDYGTLLGAHRHKGFVPWDDDMDISMPRNDYEKFIKIFPEEINKTPELKENLIISKLTQPHTNYPEKANILDKANNGTFILFFQCATKKPYVHFDVFPKDYIEDEGLTPDRNEKQTKLQIELREKIENNTWTLQEGLKTQREKLKHTDQKTENLTDAIDGLHNNIHNRIYPTNTIFPLTQTEFEQHQFPTPQKIDQYLPLIYGPDYMHIPHIALDHSTEDILQQQYNNNLEQMNEDFQKMIKLLKKINDDYPNA